MVSAWTQIAVCPVPMGNSGLSRYCEASVFLEYEWERGMGTEVGTKVGMGMASKKRHLKNDAC